MASMNARETLSVKQAAEYAKGRPSYLAAEYAKGRPSYPTELFDLILAHVSHRHLAWDVGTGTGQAAVALSEVFERVVATDISEQQISKAQSRENISYIVTSATAEVNDLEEMADLKKESVDLITVAEALHWFDLPRFYENAKYVLKKESGVMAAWCYSEPRFEDDGPVDDACKEFYRKVDPFMDPAKHAVDDHYKSIPFPFGCLEGLDSTGPFELPMEKKMDLDGILTYLRSWSAYQAARSQGVEILDAELVGRFERAWGEDAGGFKTARFPLFLRIGKV